MSFTRLDASSAADWARIGAAHAEDFRAGTGLRVMDLLRALKPLELGFPCDQLHHALQTATLARRDGADDEEQLAALCHDMGKAISVPNHPAIAAEMLRPYVRDDVYCAVLHHQEFQGRYYYAHFGRDPNLRDAHAAAPWFTLCEKLVDRWDNPAFDPEFEADPLESFEPLVMRMFAAPRMM
ncbi:HD domain-containing protein [Sphingomonas sp. 1P06PA]|uniref:HD domain-containing protein n=1 Tax=Sphingomonas sp. 1P06PA TaxID=554121 RepID=UPI0039A486E4